MSIFREKTGGITFGDFMEFLSVISKGTTHDKLSWAFTFYDVDDDGVISQDEMQRVKGFKYTFLKVMDMYVVHTFDLMA